MSKKSPDAHRSHSSTTLKAKKPPASARASRSHAPTRSQASTITSRRSSKQLEDITHEDCLTAANGLLSIVSETSEQISAIAAKKADSGSKVISDRAKLMKAEVSEMRDRVSSKLSEKQDDLSAIIEDITETTSKVLENGKTMEARIKELENGPEKEGMSENTKMMLMLVGGLFLMHFGVSPQMIGLAGMAFKVLTDKSDKPLSTKVTDLAKDVLRNNSLSTDLQKKAFGKLANYTPALARMGIDPESAREALTSPNAPEELLQKARSMLAKLPSRDEAPDIIKARIQKELKAKIAEKLEGNPDLKTHLTAKLDLAMGEQGNKILGAITTSQETLDSSSIMQKAKDLAHISESINGTIDKFYTSAIKKDGAPLSATDKILIAEIRDSMKSHVQQRYEKPIRDFCATAQKRGTTALAQRLNVSGQQVSALSRELERTFGTGQSRR